MYKQGIRLYCKSIALTLFLLLPASAWATFIESTIGAAVVNDATATYYNPAALTLVNNLQIIGLGTVASLHTRFRGETIQKATGDHQNGNASTSTNYYLPSLYIGIPTNKNVNFGLAIIANDFMRDVEAMSVLRYIQSNNHIQDIDVIPSLGIAINKILSVGAGLIVSEAKFLLLPITGAPSLNIPDSQSRNETRGTSTGGTFGILVKPAMSTLIGLNYRTGLTYELNGTSLFEGPKRIFSPNYHHKFWTPARSVLSISHFFSQKFGMITTAQYLETSIYKKLIIHNIASQRGIVKQAEINFNFHNAWVLTVGAIYRIQPTWVARVAGSFIQSPSNGHYQISNGDSYVTGVSMSYQFNKFVQLDGSYAHAFIQQQTINIQKGRFIINGINNGSRDSVSLKLTLSK